MSIIGIDFDGTCVFNDFPYVGDNVPRAVETLTELTSAGHKLILYTMRSDDYLKDAIKWFNLNSIALYGIQYDPEQIKWTTSNKCNADLIIDDRNLGIPLIRPVGKKPYVDWETVREMLKELRII